MNEQSNNDAEIFGLLEQKATREQGFRLLVRSYQERIYWTVRRMLDQHSEADDVVQEIFIKLYRHIDGFNKESSLYTWIYRIAVNETLGHIRKSKRYKTSDLSEAQSYHSQTTSTEGLGAKHIEEVLSRAVNLLPEKQKIVFNLRYYQEMRYSKMAEVLETSEGALKASYHHAVKKIEQYIQEHGTEAIQQ